MGFEDLSQDLEWEARRFAAAFGVSEWFHLAPNEYDGTSMYEATLDGVFIHLEIFIPECQLDYVKIGRLEREGDRAQLYYAGEEEVGGSQYRLEANPKYNHLLARGLYRLGCEDEEMLDKLNWHLTAHEKMELRLSMPREFWSPKWRDEEAH